MVRFASIEDPERAGWEVRLRCRACGAATQRPVAYLIDRHGADSTEAVERRARCLRYIDGVRCGGRAVATLQRSPKPSPKYWPNYGPVPEALIRRAEAAARPAERPRPPPPDPPEPA